MLKRIYAIFVARNLEFYRDKSSFGWNFAFPIIIIIGLSFAFDENNAEFTIGVIGLEQVSKDHPIHALKYAKLVPQQAQNQSQSISKVERHGLDMLIDLTNQTYWVNVFSSKGYMLEGLISDWRFQRQEVSGESVRYIDWVIPGVLAMNMMFSALWGIGYVIVRYRKNGVLKRLKATPVGALDFLLAQLISRVWLLIFTNGLIFVGLNYFLNFKMHGQYFDLFIIFLLGGMSLLSMGLLVAARIRSEEVAGGLLNLVSWPMMILSGIWFSLEGAGMWMQKAALAFPLTHLTTGARKIMLDGAGLGDLTLELTVLSVSSVVLLLLGGLIFKWE